MDTDLTFITNEKSRNLLERFRVLIKDTRFFDCLVGYFYTSGFYKLYKSLEKTEKIRILIGIKTDKEAFELIKEAKKQQALDFSHTEVKEKFSNAVTVEMEKSEDKKDVEEGVQKFLEWLRTKKLEIRAFPTSKIHAKLYIMTFAKGDRDIGRVITGSSNFSQAGLVDNLEFNVELKNPSDYRFALEKFNQLWVNAVDVSEKYAETINQKTWLNNTITPYELYLKFLYEYFREKINLDLEDIHQKYLPEEFLDLEYQREAVKDAKTKLEEYGGVFISDVVGLGKTYISAMLAQQLDGRNLVIAPPMLLREENLGSWPNVFSDFRIPADYQSLGKLDKLVKRGTEKYKNIFIDEAHRFRTETTITYEKLAQICRGKRVILVSATPLNNTPKDILAQIKLFQKIRKSTIPGIPNLEQFFNNLSRKLKGLDRQRDYKVYIKTVKENAQEIREKVLKYLMVRRTRNEIIKYFSEDLKKRKLKFPEVAAPKPIFYEFDEQLDRIFTHTIKLILSPAFKYSRYTPKLYYKGEITQPEKLAQKNMGKFMKILLIKRLESSFFAFRNTLNRFIHSYTRFIEEYDKGYVYVSKKYINKIFEFLENDDEKAIQRLIDEDKAEKYSAKNFRKAFIRDLQSDLAILQEVYRLWSGINYDPKLEKFIKILSNNKLLRENKIIVFTESKETAQYLGKNLKDDKVIVFSGGSSAAVREKVIENFDAKVKFPKDDYRILVTTEVLSEGVNLHQANIVINYDIPWNPTRMMQRVGRINRIDTKFDKIYTYNFFPTKQSNDLIKLKEAAEGKIHAFIEMLGNDARLLTEGEEIKSHDLFTRLTSKKTITGEDEEEETELEYLKTIREIRDKDPDLFEKIKRLPKKARTAKKHEKVIDAVLTYFRKGKLQKFYLSASTKSQELGFFSAAKLFYSKKNEKRQKLGADFYKYLDKNKRAFEEATIEEIHKPVGRRGRDSAAFVLKILKTKEIKHCQSFTEDAEAYIQKVIRLLEEGGLPKQTTKRLAQKLERETKPLKILGILKTNIAPEFFKATMAESAAITSGPREVILSEYFVGK